MSTHIEISDVLPENSGDIEQLYRDAFPDEDLVPLVKKLLVSGDDVLSLTATKGGNLVGHAVFTTCGIAVENETSDHRVALLGPVAVLAALQKQGIGGRMIQEGLERLTVAGIAQVFVLGDPSYYSRFGFQEDGFIIPPYPLTEQWRPAWQSKSLQNDMQVQSGILTVPVAWKDASLWS
ncbi:GNAT family N-acetyltransferase [Parasedimentitalea huanghaiensis]|uniref:GNAT family N-acetyltransferase n=1 Tax=Parasedimentitalea huanghaiensis TaxID=2682100 RepID=UPI0014308F49|nr:N-acetyltransferase [Zongyanglinia huanghaiensis]